VGSTNRRADSKLVEELRRFARGEAFDEQPMPGLDSEGLDFPAASESFATVRKLARRDLQILRLVSDHQGQRMPTVGGMLLFGHDRERHFPDAWIQAGRFDGRDKSASSTAPRFTPFRCAPPRKRSPSFRSTHSTGPKSAMCAERSAGTCPP
jgi:predicted HTH transcriptional regulator